MTGRARAERRGDWDCAAGGGGGAADAVTARWSAGNGWVVHPAAIYEAAAAAKVGSGAIWITTAVSTKVIGLAF